ncbi:TPA: acyl-ACP--UDP-N-acetylglucosamine O-acyltransferase [Candidatus Spyradomonas excrementavium]|nr:acyl-ACP--UDP-N-acetylglucosamine O-acyltransferase [Candidatus Spyradomonas excrementavium]
MIDKRAIISDDAQIGQNVTIGANAVIGENVKIGDNVIIMPNAYLEHCEIGDGTLISPFASIGTAPQDLGYKGQPTKSIIGKNCIIKEYATVNRAATEGDATIVGDKCMLMTSTHVAHNCVLENEVIMANLATIGGHCHVGFGAFIGGMSVFHQNVRIGEMCIVSGFSAARMDVLPYCKGEGRPPIPHGINSIGLKRRGIPLETRENLKHALKILKSGEYLISVACDVIEQEVPQDEYVKKFVKFIRESKRGITLRKAENTLC